MKAISIQALALLALSTSCADKNEPSSDAGSDSDVVDGDVEAHLPDGDLRDSDIDDATGPDGADGTPNDGGDGDLADADQDQRELSQFPWAEEATDRSCSDGADNDDNGYADCNDFGCSRNLAVTVCGDRARYEASPDLCSNGRDDDDDQLVDCDDPDCRDNPFHDSCPQLVWESSCAENGDSDGDGLEGCDDLDCVLTRAAGCALGGRQVVLFDQTLDETAAGGPNSDWIVDGYHALPHPTAPESADDWNGVLSSFGFDLLQSGGFLVKSLPSWSGQLTFEQRSQNPQDLGFYSVLVVMEPSRAMTPAEMSAIIEFVRAGGGLLAVANHVGADRDGNGFAAPQVWNDMFDNNPLGPDPFGFRFDEVDLNTGRPLDTILDAHHPVLDGPQGTVSRIGFYQGCSAQLTGTNNSAIGLISVDGTSDGTDNLAVGAVEVGLGRVVFVTDSAIAGDGTDSHGNRRMDHDSWNNTSQDNRALFLNAIHWLAQ